MLGAGGMGIVYHAWDDELGVAVALKVIRPEVMSDPATASEVEKRFKRELLLARQVTHRNVVRIHDLGDVEGVRYLTMPFVEGRNLSEILRESGKLAVPLAVAIAREIAAGLAAAHDAGVVHRDLKPENIMVEGEHYAQIMDFGISRSSRAAALAARPPQHTVSGSARFNEAALMAGMTMVGTVVGTVEYMAPEQARGQEVDQRADLYAFGLIFRDMLIGRRQHAGQSALDELRARMEATPPSPRAIDESIPEPVDRIIRRCLEPDPQARYSSTQELVADLDRLDPDGNLLPEPKRITRRQVIGASALVMSLLAGTWWLARTPVPPPQPAPVSVLIGDFANRTGDPAFEGTVEQALRDGIEGASFVNSYPRQDARALAAQIRPGAALDEEIARLVAIREEIKFIVGGTVERAGDGYRVVVRLIDPSGQQEPSEFTASVDGREQVLAEMGSLAARLRRALGDVTPDQELGRAETFTTSSLEAVRSYTLGQDLAYAEKDEEAIAHFKRATELDPSFGRAYANWALSATHLGRREEADQTWKKALALLDRMSEREKYRTLGAYYSRVVRNNEKAIENYETLLRLYPGDATGHGNLAVAYFRSLNFPKALESGRHAIELMPRSLRYRVNYVLYAMYAGDFESAAAEAARIIKDDPSDPYAYLPLAVAALDSGKLPDARNAYAQMASTGSLGASIANMGLADIALYEDRPADAEALLREGIVEDERKRNSDLLAAKLNALAEARLRERRSGAAADDARRAAKLGGDAHMVVPAARVLLRAGQVSEAKAIATRLQNSLQPQARAYGHLIAGDLALSERRYFEALEAFRAGVDLADFWLIRFLMGVAYVEASAYAEAISELELCQKRRGEATAVFLDDVPSFRYLAPLPYWLGRAQEGLGLTTPAADNYKKFLQLRRPATDPLAADAARRLAALK